MNDIYYEPGAFGLEQVAMIDFSSGSYEFNYLVAWRHTETGRIGWASDYGCSCPSPFEGYDLRDLTWVDDTPESWAMLEDRIKSLHSPDYQNRDVEIVDFLRVVAEHTRRKPTC